MKKKTPFGMLTIPPATSPATVHAVLRALDWCDGLQATTFWERRSVEGRISLVRMVNRRTVEIHPLEAAEMDLGLKTRFATNHLPVPGNPIFLETVNNGGEEKQQRTYFYYRLKN